MESYGGWTGRLLVVDLTSGETELMDTMDYARGFIGGRGLAAALAWEMLRPGVGPFDPESPLMFLTGPLSGTTAPASGRLTICGLAPQSYPIQWFSRASMGGNVGHQLKYAGYDGLIVHGMAPRPVYLWVHDEEVELRDASDLWGLGINDTQEALRQALGAEVQVATIGPAGESRSCIATIGTNAGSAAGQGGFGAVMGSKNLKALAVHGTGRPSLADPEGFRSLARGIAREVIEDGRNGPPRSSAALPYGARRNHCSATCIVGCGTHYEGVQGTVESDRVYSGIVQCTAGRFGGATGHYWDLGFEAGFELNMLANDWGINHWDLMKGLFPWIGMCHRDGLLHSLDERRIEPHAPRFWYDVLRAIATREGDMAEIVADGGRRAIARTGCLPDEGRQIYAGWGYANHWDGRGPRGNRIVYPFWLASALLWMAETRDPMGSTHGYVQNMMRVSPFGVGTLTWAELQEIGQRIYGRREAMDPLSDYEGKAEPALWHARRSLIKDSLPLCDRVFPRLFSSLTEDGIPRVDGLQGPDFEARLYSLATGHEISSSDLEESAERALTLERAQQARDYGRTRDWDQSVLDFFCETDEEYRNPLLGEKRRAEPIPLSGLADEFYALRGWDRASGLPTEERLRTLGLSHVIGEMGQSSAMPDPSQPSAGEGANREARARVSRPVGKRGE